MSKPIFIAEIKTISPFGFKSEESWDDLAALAIEHGDWVAVHTHPAWGAESRSGWDGRTATKLITKVRAMTKKPILAKGIHHSDYDVAMAIQAGADYVLTVGRVSEKWQAQTIFEPLNLDQMYLPMYVYPDLKVMWNARDLVTGDWKPDQWKAARAAHKGWLCMASGLQFAHGLSTLDADAYIVGTHLRDFVKSKTSQNYLCGSFRPNAEYNRTACVHRN